MKYLLPGISFCWNIYRLTVDFDWESGVDFAVDVFGLAGVDAGVFVDLEVGDHQDGLAAVRLEVGHQQDVVVLTKKDGGYRRYRHIKKGFESGALYNNIKRLERIVFALEKNAYNPLYYIDIL